MNEITNNPIMLHTVPHIIVSFSLWVLVVLAILLDLWDGLVTARNTHKTIKSNLLRITLVKIAEYWRPLLAAFIIDSMGLLMLIVGELLDVGWLSFYIFPFAGLLIAIGEVIIEILSLREHAKERKSKTAELEGVIGAIISCATPADATGVLEKVKDYLETKKETKKGKEDEV